jgi:hypothetical protein
MKHLAKVYSGDTEILVTSSLEDYLSKSVHYCNEHAQTGDTCVITESYETLTGREEYDTIMTWTKIREDMYV